VELHNIKFYEHRLIVPELFQARRRTDSGLYAFNWCSAEMPTPTYLSWRRRSSCG